jgi:hypothetical protein
MENSLLLHLFINTASLKATKICRLQNLIIEQTLLIFLYVESEKLIQLNIHFTNKKQIRKVENSIKNICFLLKKLSTAS